MAKDPREQQKTDAQRVPDSGTGKLDADNSRMPEGARAAPGVGTLRPLRSPRRRIAPARPLDVALPTLATVAHVARPRRTDVALRWTRVLGLAETAGVAIVPIVAHALGARAPARAIRS